MLSPFSDLTGFTSKYVLQKFTIPFDKNFSFVQMLCTAVL